MATGSLRRTSARLRRDNQSEVARGIAHELNNLVQSILANATVARMDQNAEDRTNQCLNDISAAGRRVAGLSEQLVAHFGDHALAPRPERLAVLLQSTTKLLHSRFPSVINISMQLRDVPDRVEVSPTQLREALVEVLMACGRALAKTGGELTITNQVRTHGASSFAEISLDAVDQGAERVGKPGARVEQLTRELAAANNIFCDHGGSLDIEELETTHLRVRISLPECSARQGPGALRSSTCSVMVIDPQGRYNSEIRRALATAGHSLIVANTARDAMEKLRYANGEIAVILLAIDSIDAPLSALLTDFQEASGNVPVVLLTAHDGPVPKVLIEHPSVFTVLNRPFTDEILARTVVHALAVDSEEE